MVHLYEFKRTARINEIAEMLKNMKAVGEQASKKQIILKIMNAYNISQRTASEYLGVAILKNVIS